MIRKIMFISIVWFFTVSLNAATYFVDEENGNDLNNGISQLSAWKTTQKINAMIFKPGDKILFRRGGVFSGYLHLKGNGSNDYPIILSSYGTGKRPVISAEGKRYAIMMMNSRNWKISDMETKGSIEAGIFAGCSSNDLILGNITISNCYVHHIGDTAKVSWDLSTFTGGIIVVNGSLDDQFLPVSYNSVFNNVTIEGCSVFYNYRWTCISITSGKINGTAGDSNRIRNCTVAYSSADGIRMNGVSNSFIEYCILFRNGGWPNPEGQNLGGLGAWFFDAENCTIQYCEAGWVRTIVSDGGAFDIDYRQKNSTVQYCYGHHCASYGVSVFGADPTYPTINSTIRYNIFSSNAMDKKFGVQGEYFVFTWSGGKLNGVKIHDNISYWDPVVAAPAHNFNADFTGSNTNKFTRNTVISRKPWLAYHKNDSMVSDSNVFISTGTPVYWKMRNDSFDSHGSWKSATGMDRNSTFKTISNHKTDDEKLQRVAVPDWYKFQSENIILKNSGTGKEAELGDQVGNIVGRGMQGKPVIILFTGMQQNPTALGLRTQMNYLNSMKRQYESKGLEFIIIDESKALNSHISDDELKNFLLDNSFEEPVWIRDDSMKLAGKFGVTSLPATFLVSSEGILTGKWEGVVLPAELAFAIEKEL